MSERQGLSAPMKGLLASSGVLALVAGPVLYLFPYDTGSYFAWTIRHPLTPVFMGASYLAGVGNLWAIRSGRWQVARAALPPIFVFGAGQLVATLLHLDIFNWSHPVAWAWLAVYVGSPPAALALFQAAEKRSGAADERQGGLPEYIRPVMAFWAALFGIIGLALFLLPPVMAGLWPWSLTPLTSRVIGAWYLASATLAAVLSRQHSGETAWIGFSAGLVVTPLLLIGAAVHRSEFNGPAASVGMWLLTVAGYGATSLMFWLACRRRGAAPGERARVSPEITSAPWTGE